MCFTDAYNNGQNIHGYTVLRLFQPMVYLLVKFSVHSCNLHSTNQNVKKKKSTKLKST